MKQGEWWVIYRNDQGYIRARGPGLLEPGVLEIEACRASELTTANRQVEGLLDSYERMKIARSDALRQRDEQQARADATEAQLDTLREKIEPVANAKGKWPMAVRDFARSLLSSSTEDK